MTQTVLEIQSSARFDGSVTRKLTAEYLAKADAGTVITRELTQGVELLNPEWVGATFTPVDDRTDAQKAALKGSDVLVAELMAADTILIGAPIYNANAAASGTPRTALAITPQ